MATCDPAFQKELDRISAQIDLEDEMAFASTQMEISELVERARFHGNGYGAGFGDGLLKGIEIIERNDKARSQSVSAKFDELNKRQGLSHD